MSDASEVQFEKLEIFQNPQCLIATDANQHLITVKETLEQLKEITVPVNVVAIAGLYRTGKSYLMNRLANHTSGFALGNSIQSKTKGIWIWCKIHPTQKNQVLVLLDTEGLGDVEKVGGLDHDNKIFVIATLLSSTLVYNLMTAFNQDAVEKLTFITEMSKNLKVSAGDSSDENFDLLMPEFVLCIRDFTLKLEIDGRKCNEDEYLEFCLHEKTETSKDVEKYNRPRRCIKKYFTKRKAFTFDRPGSRKMMENLDKARNEDLSEDFVEETVKFTSYVYERPSKMLQNKKPVTGRMLADVLTVLIEAMKNGQVPCMEDAITVMSKQENTKRAEAAIVKFKTDLKKLTVPVASKTELLEKNFQYQTGILTDLNSELLFDDEHVVEKSVKAEMDKIFKEFETENASQLYGKCLKLIHEMYVTEIEGKVKGGKYSKPGGYGLYKADMQQMVEKYTEKLEKENVDHLQIQKAKHDFLTECITEGEGIMNEDKLMSEKEKQEEMRKREEKLKQDYEETKEKEKKRYEEELEKQNKQHEKEIDAMRTTQAEKEKSYISAYLQEMLGRRGGKFHDIEMILARLIGREDERQKSTCTIS